MLAASDTSAKTSAFACTPSAMIAERQCGLRGAMHCMGSACTAIQLATCPAGDSGLNAARRICMRTLCCHCCACWPLGQTAAWQCRTHLLRTHWHAHLWHVRQDQDMRNNGASPACRHGVGILPRRFRTPLLQVSCLSSPHKSP